MPPMGALDLLIGGNSASMYPGTSLTMPNMLNVSGAFPGMNGPSGMLAQLFMQPLLQGMLGPRYVPGQFSPRGNLYDFYQQQSQFNSMQKAIGAASEVDQNTYIKFAQGMSTMMGHRFTDDRARAARIMAHDIGAVTPLLSQMMPEMFDSLHGSRGSAQVMARSLYQGGRYMIDPVTGRQGLSADTVTSITDRARSMFWGPGSDPGQFNGLSAGRVGMLADELTRRGQLYPAMRREQMLTEIAREDVSRRMPGLKGADLDREIADTAGKLEKVGDDKVRNFQADRVLNRVKELSKVVGAVQDIFGELGRPDAPMNELLQGLQTLTQGGLQNLSGRQAEDMVRSFSNIARRTGVGLDNATALVAAGGQRAEQIGVNRILGANAAINSMAFGQAFGVNEGGITGFNRQSKEQMTAGAAKLMLGAAASGDANQLAAFLRMADTGMIKPKGELAAFASALREGQNEYSFGGVTKQTYMRPGEFISFMAKNGVNPNMLNMAIGQVGANQATINQYGLGNVSFDNQGVQFRQFMENSFRTTGTRLNINGKLMSEVSKFATSAMMDGMLTAEQRESPAALADVLRNKFKGRMTEEQIFQFSNMAVNNFDTMIRRNDKARGLYGNASSGMSFYSKQNRDTRRSIMIDNQVEGMIQSATAGLGRDNFTQRLADSILEAGPKTTMKDVLAKSLGAIPTDEVMAKLEEPMRNLQDAMAKVKATDNIKNPIERRKAAQARIEEVKSANTALQKMTKELNLDTGAAVSRKDITGIETLLKAGSGKGLLEMEEVTQALLNDDTSMEVLGPGGLKLGKSILSQKMAIEKAAAASGLAVDDFLKTKEGGKMLGNFQKTVADIGARLASPSKKKIGIDERKDIAKYNALRTESPRVTMERIRRSAGLLSGSMDKSMAGLEANGSFAGLAGASLREASSSLESLRNSVAADLNINPKDLTPEMFANALKNGGKLKEEDQIHLLNITAGSGVVGTGLSRLLGKNVSNEDVLAAANDYRRSSDPGSSTARRFLKGLGVVGKAADGAANAAFGMSGQSLTNLQQSAYALQSLRAKWGGNDITDKQFSKLLEKGDVKDEEEKALYAQATRGKAKELSDAIGSQDQAKLTNVMKMIADQREPTKVEIAGTTKVVGTLKLVGVDNPNATADIEAEMSTTGQP